MLTGGPHEGDIGRVMGKNEDGHYRIRFENSFNRTLNMKMRPFSLWLGSWWIDEAARGFGIVPKGKVPFVTVDTADFTRRHDAATVVAAAAAPQPRPRVTVNPNAPRPPPPPPAKKLAAATPIACA